ncbi:condensation domain-containing protein [Streptomyces sp. NPDC006539]|uniref:condensation domain-containing protein n=1 Tax=Streptomyces sp. NPDC006539 TaxID=3155352 RepID=UPI0033A85F17
MAAKGGSGGTAIRPPATSGQRRLWAAEQLTGGTGEYNVPVALRLHGPLDTSALQSAFQALITRHESLRSTFDIGSGGTLRWAAQAPQECPVRVVDFAGGSSPADAVTEFVDSLAWKPFDLASEVLRIVLLRLAVDDHVLLCVGHHVLFDDWATTVFFRELEVLYAAAVRGITPSRVLPPLAYGYTDLSMEERRQLTRGGLDAQFSYWEKHLSDASPLSLPTDRPRPATGTALAERYRFALPGALIDRLTEVARSSRATLFMILMAGFHALLREWTGQSDITVGTAVTGRTTPDREALITCMVNTLAIRSAAPREATFTELLDEVRKRTLMAFAQADAPFDEVIARLPSRSDGLPLVRAMFEFQNTTMDVAALHGDVGDLPTLQGLRTAAYPISRLTVRYDLELALGATQDGLSASIVYPVDLFDPQTIATLAENYTAILRTAADTGHQHPASPMAEA